ncbi:MAG: hypothetical protein DHS20C08_06170 [Rhodomicrobium sp.]|nr:MAG: hypothetical protein DHS20C08_06170 [Rhodomicrobium sp.]
MISAAGLTALVIPAMVLTAIAFAALIYLIIKDQQNGNLW